MILFILCTGAGIAQVHPSQDPNYTLVFHEDFVNEDSEGNVIEKNEYLHQNWQSAWPYNQFTPEQLSAKANGAWPIEKVMQNRAYIKSYESYLDGLKTSFPNVILGEGLGQIFARKEATTGIIWYYRTEKDSEGNDKIVRYDSLMNFNYSMGMLRSKRSYRYGYFEARIKIPIPPQSSPDDYFGVGSNFWMFGGGGKSWPAVSEIDLLESCTRRTVGNVDYEPYGGVNDHFAWCNKQNPDCDGGDPEEGKWHSFSTEVKHPYPNGFASNGFFTLGVNWSENSIKYYLNGEELFESTNFPEERGPEHIILDLNHPTDQYGFYEVGENNIYPYTLEVDYVKVFQEKNICNGEFFLFDFSYATIKELVYKNVNVGVNSTFQFIPVDLNADGIDLWGKPGVNTDLNLKATEEIVFQGEVSFTSNDYQELTVQILECE